MDLGNMLGDNITSIPSHTNISDVTTHLISAVNQTAISNITSNMTSTNLTSTTEKVDYPNFYDLVYALDLYKSSQWISAYKFAFLTPIGIIGNVLALAVFAKKATVLSSYTFMAILALADMSFIICSTVTSQFFASKSHWLSDLSCKFISVIQDGLIIFAVWLVVAMSIERLLVIWFPLKFKDWCSPIKALMGSCILLVCIAIFLTHYWWTIAKRQSGYMFFCMFHVDYKFVVRPWTTAFAIIYSWLPFVSLLIINTGLIIGMVRITRKRAQLKSNTNNDQLIRITIMAVTVSIMYILLTGPYTIWYFVNDNGWNEFWHTPEDFAQYVFLNQFFLMLVNMNHCVNFYLYFLSGRTFRKEFMEMITCGRWKAKDKTLIASKTRSTELPSASAAVSSNNM